MWPPTLFVVLIYLSTNASRTAGAPDEDAPGEEEAGDEDMARSVTTWLPHKLTSTLLFPWPTAFGIKRKVMVAASPIRGPKSRNLAGAGFGRSSERISDGRFAATSKRERMNGQTSHCEDQGTRNVQLSVDKCAPRTVGHRSSPLHYFRQDDAIPKQNII